MSKTLGGRGGKRMITEINVTPFVDVVLVLLIIFMVTATYISRGSVDMRLPKASSAGEMSKSPVVIGVDQNGDYTVEGEPASEEEVVAYIKKNVAADPTVEAVITGDTRVQYGKVMTLINLAMKNGVQNFAAAVEKSEDAQ